MLRQSPAKRRKDMPDHKIRCAWIGDDLMRRYHDEEWGVPVFDDRKQFEFLMLESAQAGLSWAIILRKRENYRKAFASFNPQKIAEFKAAEIRKLLKNPGIIRNRLKIESAVINAQRFLDIQKEFGKFSNYIWQFVKGKPRINRWETLKQLPALTAESETLSRDLKKRGFKFLGPTVLYSHMQATGMINDHMISCFRYRELAGK